jgi:serine/threonine-protein kinase
MSLDAARQVLRQRHLAIGSVTKEPKADVPQSTILRQSASPGSKVEAETPIDLTVSEGPAPTVEVPDLSGLALDAARQVLRGRKLEVGSITGEPKDDAAQNTILRQTPSPGSKVKKGTSIDLIVSEVPAPNP